MLDRFGLYFGHNYYVSFVEYTLVSELVSGLVSGLVSELVSELVSGVEPLLLLKSVVFRILNSFSKKVPVHHRLGNKTEVSAIVL